MKFLKALTQKKLAKAVVCGLVLSGGMLVGMGQVFAETYVSGAAEYPAMHWYVGGSAYGGDKVVVSKSQTGDQWEYANGYSIYGYYLGLSGTLEKGTVEISGGEISGPVFGGHNDSGNAINNTVTISGGEVQNVVYGGHTSSGDASYNIVNISDGNISKMEVWGGRSENNGDANNNIVNISGGYIANIIRAGQARTGNVNNNVVNISGGTMNSSVYGGRVTTGSANNNIVNISGGTIGGDVYAGSGSDDKIGNKVNLIGDNGELKVTVGYDKEDKPIEDTLKNSNKVNISGYVFGSNKANGTGNTLNVAGTGTKVGNIENFQNLNFHVTQDMIGKSMLIINTPKDKNTVLPEASGISILAVGDVTLKAGDQITLIDKKDTGKLSIGSVVIEEAGEVEGIDATVIKSAVASNPAKVVVGGEGDNDLILTVGEEKNPGNDEMKANIAKNMVETRAAGLAIVNEGVDFMVEHGMANAKVAIKEAAAAGDKGLAPFAAIGGGKMRYNSGSHIDSKSWHGAVGVAKEIGNMTIGFAVDHGKTSFDSYNDGGVTGSGDSKATGASVMAEIKKDNGVHYDGSIRAGRVKNDYSAMTSYDQSSTYYGLSLGGGKEFAVSDKNVVDVYGRYFWTHTNSSDATDNIGTKLEFDAINSHRVRVGGRFTHDVNDISKLYAGLAWQHEFKGDTRATVGGFEAPAPSLKGNTGIMELGWKVNANKNLDLDLGATGYTGKQKGASLNLALNFKF